MGDCKCYCVLGYRATIPNSDVSFPGFPKLFSFNFGFRNIEVDQGEEMWDGDATQKDYNCESKIVDNETTIPTVLPRHVYLKVSE